MYDPSKSHSHGGIKYECVIIMFYSNLIVIMISNFHYFVIYKTKPRRSIYLFVHACVYVHVDVRCAYTSAPEVCGLLLQLFNTSEDLHSFLYKIYLKHYNRRPLKLFWYSVLRCQDKFLKWPRNCIPAHVNILFFIRSDVSIKMRNY